MPVFSDECETGAATCPRGATSECTATHVAKANATRYYKWICLFVCLGFFFLCFKWSVFLSHCFTFCVPWLWYLHCFTQRKIVRRESRTGAMLTIPHLSASTKSASRTSFKRGCCRLFCSHDHHGRWPLCDFRSLLTSMQTDRPCKSYVPATC